MRKITLNFLVTGHSQNENDNAHSVIETATKKKTIFTTAEWETAIRMSFKTQNPSIDVLDFTSVYDFKSPSTFPMFSAIWRNTVKITKGKNAGEKLKWANMMQMEFRKDEPGVISFKYKYSDAEFQSVKIEGSRASTRNSSNEFPIELPKLYEKEPGISEDKRKDLVKLCEKNLIPPRFHSFYKSLHLKSQDSE